MRWGVRECLLTVDGRGESVAGRLVSVLEKRASLVITPVKKRKPLVIGYRALTIATTIITTHDNYSLTTN